MTTRPSQINAELARILTQRIEKLVRKARYEPASVMDEAAAAAEVVRPYLKVEGAGLRNRTEVTDLAVNQASPPLARIAKG